MGVKPKIYIINKKEPLFIKEVEDEMFRSFEVINIKQDDIELDFFLNLMRPKRIIDENIISIVANNINNRLDNALNDILNNSTLIKKVLELQNEDSMFILNQSKTQLLSASSAQTIFDPQRWLGKEITKPVFVKVGQKILKFINKGEIFDFKDLERCKNKNLFFQEPHQTSILIFTKKDSLVYKTHGKRI